MVVHHQQGPAQSTSFATPRQRWLARLAFLAAFLAAAVLVVFAGLRTVPLLILVVGALAVGIAAFFWFLTNRGALWWISLGVLVLTPIVVVVLLIRAQLLWVVLLTLGLAVLAGICARAALHRDHADWVMPEHPAPSPKRAFLVMNPRSGGGKVVKFDLKKQAEALGAEVDHRLAAEAQGHGAELRQAAL